MGLVNQGWFVRCDNCDQADDGTIGCRTQRDAIADARQSGWIRRKGRWFCCELCFIDWKDKAA